MPQDFSLWGFSQSRIDRAATSPLQAEEAAEKV